ncbi:MAG: hypothetical protein JWQ28_1076 [Pedobacter sp.]|nr:hypothetical protein [Pedobacter sp.]
MARSITDFSVILYMKAFKITTAAQTTYTVSPLKEKPNAFEVSKDKESCLFFIGSKGDWSTGDFAPPFSDFDILEIGKLIEFELKDL